MPSRFSEDGSSAATESLEGVDRHYYEKQIGPSSPGDNTQAFKLAAAVAKDRARHELIKAIRVEDARLRGDSIVGIGDFSGEARANVYANRTVDGVRGASDDAIKL
jgi:hypothetical protein